MKPHIKQAVLNAVPRVQDFERRHGALYARVDGRTYTSLQRGCWRLSGTGLRPNEPTHAALRRLEKELEARRRFL